MSFQDLWNKFSFVFQQLCGKKTCGFVVMGIGKKVVWAVLCVLYYDCIGIRQFSTCFVNFTKGYLSDVLHKDQNLKQFLFKSLYC